MGRTSAAGRSNGVRRARTALGLSQAELAAHAGVTRQTLVALEGGGYAPSVYLALAVAARLERTVEQLFGDTLTTTPTTKAMTTTTTEEVDR